MYTYFFVIGALIMNGIKSIVKIFKKELFFLNEKDFWKFSK